MSRTHRNIGYDHGFYRHPRTTAERRQLSGLVADARLHHVKISPSNRFSRHIPEEYDDVLVSSLFENFFSEKPRMY